MLEFSGSELGAVIATQSFGDSILGEQNLYCISNCASCEAVKFSNKQELGIVNNNYKEPRLLSVKEISTHSLPRVARDFLGYHRFLLLGVLILLADFARNYDTLYVCVYSRPVNTGFGSQFAFFHASQLAFPLVFCDFGIGYCFPRFSFCRPRYDFLPDEVLLHTIQRYNWEKGKEHALQARFPKPDVVKHLGWRSVGWSIIMTSNKDWTAQTPN